jgi:hypothetical protein
MPEGRELLGRRGNPGFLGNTLFQGQAASGDELDRLIGDGNERTCPPRHAELVSASTVQQALSAQVDKWMLKQVQHDGR